MQRSCPVNMPAEPWKQVQTRLDIVVAQEDVKILWAIESGSRAWGFPSPDSDFDCRFVYVRSLHDQIRLDKRRDVIETPLTPVLDVNGWDLAKALVLLLKNNAVVLEWLASPIIYRGDAAFRDDMIALAHKITDRSLIARHYAHLGARQWERHGDGREVKLKKLFYALRPAMALRWLRLHDDKAIPPMSFLETLQDAHLPHSLKSMILELIVEKSKTREMGDGTAPEELGAFITEELALGLELSASGSEPLRRDRYELANAVLFKWSGLAAG